uniref:Uncharacterized protein n=1 Tax=Rhipicephalus zambeziensis TaxID=60191 RepID=A0A224YAJ4_9ACAR
MSRLRIPFDRVQLVVPHCHACAWLHPFAHPLHRPAHMAFRSGAFKVKGLFIVQRSIPTSQRQLKLEMPGSSRYFDSKTKHSILRARRTRCLDEHSARAHLSTPGIPPSQRCRHGGVWVTLPAQNTACRISRRRTPVVPCVGL